MPLFRYSALARDGQKIAGDIEAGSRDAVLKRLRELGHYPVDAVEMPDARTHSSTGVAALFTTHPTKEQITLFTRELSMLLEAGLPLSQALEMLELQKDKNGIAKSIQKIRSGITEGKSLHEALGLCGSLFPPVYRNMVRIAESSGMLTLALERIADMREREQDLRSKTISALLYPSLLVITAISAIVFILIYVVPRFKSMISSVGDKLPASTKLVMAASDWLIANGLLLLLSLPVFFLGLFLMSRQPAMRRFLEGLWYRLPITGDLARTNLTARFCRTFGTLLENGVGLPEAVDLTREVVGSKQAELVLTEMGDALRKGQTISGPLARTKLFPDMVVSMLEVGEETGRLAPISLYLAKMFEDRFKEKIQRLFAILEPVIIIFVSLFVAGIIISIMSAILSVTDLVV